MTSALINEEMMMRNVQADARGDNATRLATGALLVLLDAFDRKVTRDAFVAFATTALTVNDNIGRSCAIQAIIDAAMEHTKLSLVDLQQAKADVDGYLASSTADLQKAAYLLTQMSKTGEPIS
jgi:uncharacterized protein (DUF924 family)